MGVASASIFKALTALSLLLCVATAFLWVRSIRVTDHVSWHPRPGKQCDLVSVNGFFSYTVATGPIVRTPKAYPEPYTLPSPTLANGWRQFEVVGFQDFDPAWRGDRGEMASYVHIVSVTDYVALELTSLPPTLYISWLWTRRRRRRRLGLCLRCGYDLRASTGRCSECGRTVMQAR